MLDLCVMVYWTKNTGVFFCHFDVLYRELHNAGLRLNEERPPVFIVRSDKGGIDVRTTVEQTHLTPEEMGAIIRTFGYTSAIVTLRHDTTAEQIVDALAVLLVRLHLEGFFWGDCSLNNALFRRDAGALRAYVVDTETAEWHESLTDGQRSYDLTIAVENVLGGLFDLQASQLLNPDVEPEDVALRLEERYRSLWAELNDEEEIPATELGRIHARLARLNELGFDTEEYELRSADGIARFRPTIGEGGHHVRTLERLTGVRAHENQARRLLAGMFFAGTLFAGTPFAGLLLAPRLHGNRTGRR